jgi:hypothetical protein
MNPLPAEHPIAVTLPAHQWNGVLNALNDQPYRIARPIIDAIIPQVEAEAEKLAAPAPAVKPNGSAEAHREASAAS